MEKYYCNKVLYMTNDNNLPHVLTLKRENNTLVFEKGKYYRKSYKYGIDFLYLIYEQKSICIIEKEWLKYFLNSIQLRKQKINKICSKLEIK